MTDSIRQQPQVKRRSGLERNVDRVWRFFTSVRNAIYEIAFLSLLVLIGTLRASSVPQAIADRIPALEPLVEQWYAWDVFRSTLFALTMAIIAVAIIICTLNRVPQIWAAFAHPKVTTSAGFMRGADTAATYTLTEPAHTVLERTRQVLEKRRYRLLTEDVGDDTHIYADKNRFSGFGTFPFHIGLILLLVGGIVASSYGFRDNEFVLAEGYRRNVGHGTGIAVELQRQRDSWSADGSPIDYVSEVTIYENGEAVRTGEIRVNHPLTYKSATFYQSGFGNAAEFTVRDLAGNVVYSGAVELGIFTARDNPDAPAGFIEIPTQDVRLTVIAPDNDALNKPELDKLNLAPGEMWVAMTGDTDGAVLTLGQPVQIGNYSVLFEREGRYTVLQIGYNPAIPIFLIASGFLVGGLVVTFYFPHRRIRGILGRSDNTTVLQLAPLAKHDYAGKRDFYNVLSNLNNALETSPTVRAPKNEGDYEYLYNQSHQEPQSE